ncbi:hypothetical protein EDD27_9127 [Nonomuraea polychroma]|uniref:Uncharacterized protein n=1 Tax=Nonomuraea polychroma TaxID=46176 RepID=A0A438MKN3_9ACTN|nr:hypothetical protein EDD27_9127 [Nonomuraea polychroma]
MTHPVNCERAQRHHCGCSACGGAQHGWTYGLMLARDPSPVARQEARDRSDCDWAATQPPKGPHGRSARPGAPGRRAANDRGSRMRGDRCALPTIRRCARRNRGCSPLRSHPSAVASSAGPSVFRRRPGEQHIAHPIGQLGKPLRLLPVGHPGSAPRGADHFPPVVIRPTRGSGPFGWPAPRWLRTCEQGSLNRCVFVTTCSMIHAYAFSNPFPAIVAKVGPFRPSDLEGIVCQLVDLKDRRVALDQCGTINPILRIIGEASLAVQMD